MLMGVTFRQLEYVVMVADILCFHRAAARCGVSQSTISVQIRKVETLLGLQLFLRDRRSVAVTDCGAAIVVRARGILEHMNDLVSQAGALREPAIDAPTGPSQLDVSMK